MANRATNIRRLVIFFSLAVVVLSAARFATAPAEQSMRQRVLTDDPQKLFEILTEKHFTAWLGLAPGSRQSGKRNGSVRRKRNRAGKLFCMMARSLAQSKDIALGGFYRRMAARRGGLVANIALARKLASMFWRVMVKGLKFVETGLKAYEERVIATKRQALSRLAKQLGHIVLPKPAQPQTAEA